VPEQPKRLKHRCSGCLSAKGGSSPERPYRYGKYAVSVAWRSHVLNTSPSLRSLRLENHLLDYIMPRPRPLVSSTVRRRKRADFLLDINVLIIRACASCLSLGVACILSSADERCEQYFRHNRICKLASRQDEAERILKKKDKLREKRWEAERQMVRLRKQERLL
jgi:hypothetical protein